MSAHFLFWIVKTWTKKLSCGPLSTTLSDFKNIPFSLHCQKQTNLVFLWPDHFIREGIYRFPMHSHSVPAFWKISLSSFYWVSFKSCSVFSIFRLQYFFMIFCYCLYITLSSIHVIYLIDLATSAATYRNLYISAFFGWLFVFYDPTQDFNNKEIKIAGFNVKFIWSYNDNTSPRLIPAF